MTNENDSILANYITPPNSFFKGQNNLLTQPRAVLLVQPHKIPTHELHEVQASISNSETPCQGGHFLLFDAFVEPSTTPLHQ